MKIMKIISGGQTGADRAALDAALELNVPHGGWCPRGRRSEDGPIPEWYQLSETSSADYPARTRVNVEAADATVIFSRDRRSPGTRLTIDVCKQLRRPYLVLDGRSREQDAALLGKWLSFIQPRALNVAGNRESSQPGIYDHVFAVLLETLPKVEKNLGPPVLWDEGGERGASGPRSQEI